MATNGISPYSIGGAAPLNRPATVERPREAASDEASPPPPRPSTVVEISPQARELARAAEAEQQAKRGDTPS